MGRNLLFLAGLLLTAGCATGGEPIEDEGYLRLAEGWECQLESGAETRPDAPGAGAAWQPVDSLTPRRLRASNALRCRLRLPEVPWQEDSQVFLAVHAPRFVLYLDDDRLYEAAGEAGGETWHLVDLPGGFAGRLLQVWEPDPRPAVLALENWTLIARSTFPALLNRRARAALRSDALVVPTGVLLTFLGLLSLAIGLLRRGPGRGLLVSFGAFAALYGLRLMLQIAGRGLIFDQPPFFFQFLISWITYVLTVPAFLFFERLLDPGKRSPVRHLWRLFAVFAVIAMAADVYFAAPGSLLRISSLLVLLAIAVLLATIFRQDFEPFPGLGVLRVGMLVFVALAVNANLVGMDLVPWRFNVEPLGFLVLAGSLGWAGARRVVAGERQLLSIEHELSTARTIQASILPAEMPKVEGLTLAARYRPLSSVAGDFYDFLTLDEKRLGVLVADVSGHGVPAALIASMVKVAIAAQATHAAEPAVVLERMNRVLLGHLRRQFVTAAYLWVDTEHRALTIACGGHPPPLIWRRSRAAVEEMPPGGPLLGRFDDARFTSTTLDLEPGDRILLFTDGVIEAAGAAAEPFGEERLQAALAAHAALPAERFADALLDDLARWARIPSDDLTLVVVDVADS